MDKFALSALPRIYDAATETDNWSVALDEFARANGAKSSTIYANNSHLFDYQIAASSKWLLGHQGALQHYLNEYADHDLHAINFMTSSPSYKRVEDQDIWPGFLEMRDRNDLSFLERELKVFRRVGYNLATTQGWGAFVALHFDADIMSFERSWVDNADFLVRHIGKALETNRFCSQLQDQYNAVLTVLDRVDVALCLCRADGQVVVKNIRAERIFASRNGIELDRRNSLKLDGYTQNAELQHCISEIGRTAQGKHEKREQVISVPKSDGEEAYFLEVSPLRDGADELNDGFIGSLVMIIDPAEPPNLRLQNVAILYQLTPVEAEVCEKLISGHTVGEVADMRSVTIDTVRSQVKSIYSKLGSRSRADLVRKVASISPPIIGNH